MPNTLHKKESILVLGYNSKFTNKMNNEKHTESLKSVYSVDH